MPSIQNRTDAIGTNYPVHTARFKQVLNHPKKPSVKIALMGDSTIDNGHWVQKEVPYAQKTATVIHQTATALTKHPENYAIACFAVDGATTHDLLHVSRLNRVVHDEDHPRWRNNEVHQLNAVQAFQPDIAVVSIGGNNYREALQGKLVRELTPTQLILRQTPDDKKEKLRTVFDRVKKTLLSQYKQIIDALADSDEGPKRIVLLSQYYPALSLDLYGIYTGFAHIGKAYGKHQSNLTAIEDTMNELYREVLAHAATKNKEIVFIDGASSLNPLADNLTMQIEPNARGAKAIGELIADAITYEYPESPHDKKTPVILRKVGSTIEASHDISQFSVKKLSTYIHENRYRHIGDFFKPSSSLSTRYMSAYHMSMGRRFDAAYTGLFAFGLIDLSLITILSGYLMRVVLDNERNIATRISAGVIAVPIEIIKEVIGLAMMLILALPIYGYHQLAQCFNQEAACTPDPLLSC